MLKILNISACIASTNINAYIAMYVCKLWFLRPQSLQLMSLQQPLTSWKADGCYNDMIYQVTSLSDTTQNSVMVLKCNISYRSYIPISWFEYFKKH